MLCRFCCRCCWPSSLHPLLLAFLAWHAFMRALCKSIVLAQMVSVGILHHERCPCSRLIWPLPAHTYQLCGRCYRDGHWEYDAHVMMATGKGFFPKVLPHVDRRQDALTISKSYLGGSPIARTVKRCLLRHQLLPHGHPSYFHKLTYFHNGLAGSVDMCNDIIYVVLGFL